MGPVLVTGSAGLVGYRVAEMLHEAGVDVLGIDLRPSGGAFPEAVADVTDLGAMQRAVEGRSQVVHAGAVSGPMLMRDDPFGIARINVGGAMAVFEASRRAGVRRLVFLSSIAVYGDQGSLEPVAETAPMNPLSFYGQSKCAGEALLRGYVDHYGLDAVALRLSTVYGPRRQTACDLRDAIEAALDGRAAVGSSIYRQYIHVDDAADAIRLALEAPAPGFVFNITGGSWKTDAAVCQELMAFLPELVVTPAAEAGNTARIGPLVIDAAARELGYRPRVALPDGLRALVAFYRGRVTRPSPAR